MTDSDLFEELKAAIFAEANAAATVKVLELRLKIQVQSGSIGSTTNQTDNLKYLEKHGFPPNSLEGTFLLEEFRSAVEVKEFLDEYSIDDVTWSKSKLNRKKDLFRWQKAKGNRLMFATCSVMEYFDANSKKTR